MKARAPRGQIRSEVRAPRPAAFVPGPARRPSPGLDPPSRRTGGCEYVAVGKSSANRPIILCVFISISGSFRSFLLGIRRTNTPWHPHIISMGDVRNHKGPNVERQIAPCTSFVPTINGRPFAILDLCSEFFRWEANAGSATAHGENKG